MTLLAFVLGLAIGGGVVGLLWGLHAAREADRDEAFAPIADELRATPDDLDRRQS